MALRVIRDGSSIYVCYFLFNINIPNIKLSSAFLDSIQKIKEPRKQVDVKAIYRKRSDENLSL